MGIQWCASVYRVFQKFVPICFLLTFYKSIVGFKRVYYGLQGYTRAYKGMLGFTRVC